MKRKMRFLAAFLSMVVILATAGTGFTFAKKAADDPYTVKMAFIIFGNAPRDTQAIEDAINKLTIAKINAKVKLMPINISAYNQQMNLMLSGGEQLDLMAVLSTNFAQFVNSGQIVPMDKYLANEGKGIATTLGKDFLVSGKIAGKTYAVTNLRDLAAGQGFIMRKDIADKYKINPNNIKSLNDLTKVFEIIKKNEPGMYPIIPANTNASILSNFGYGRDLVDPLTDGFGVLMLKDKNLKVINWFETKEYADRLKLVRSWNQAGYILPDAATNQETQFALIKAGKGFGYLPGTKPGFIGQESRNAGVEMTVADFAKPVSSTSNLQIVQWALTRNSKNPSVAMKMLNLFYTDSELANLIAWGIQGKHYVETSTKNVIDYPKGMDASSQTYQIGVQWEFPNEFITHIWKGDSPTLWSDMDKFNRSAQKSRAYGFTFNAAKVKTEEASITNVINQYQKSLESGAVDPAKVLPEFISKLKSAGIDRIISEKQKQLNTWLIASSKN
jgi:putative aldouronate transport system substrate-binding protein